MAFEELRDFRLKLGMTQTQFAPYMGFNRQDGYSKLENGTYKPTNQQHMHLKTLMYIYEQRHWSHYRVHMANTWGI